VFRVLVSVCGLLFCVIVWVDFASFCMVVWSWPYVCVGVLDWSSVVGGVFVNKTLWVW